METNHDGPCGTTEWRDRCRQLLEATTPDQRASVIESKNAGLATAPSVIEDGQKVPEVVDAYQLPERPWSASVYSSQDRPQVARLRQQTQPGGDAAVKAAWEANGNAVASCTEYVYEKYHSLSLFEDEMAAGGADAATIFRKAREAFGTNGVIRRRDGASSKVIARLSNTQVPKNTFFDTLNHLHAASLFVSPEIKNRLLAGLRHHTDSWAWHAHMSELLAQHPPDQLRYFEEKKRNFERALRNYNAPAQTTRALDEGGRREVKRVCDLADRLRYRLGAPASNPYAVPACIRGSMPSPANPVVVDIPTSRWRFGVTAGSSGRFGSFGRPGLQLPRAGSAGGIVPPPSDDRGNSIPALGCPDPEGRALVALSQECADRSAELSREAALRYEQDEFKRAAARIAIQQSLEEAFAIGCLASEEGPCDWSPGLFVAQFRTQAVAERERDYDRCSRLTGSEFPLMSSITNLEAHFDRKEREANRMVAGVSRWREDDRPALGDARSDDVFAGDSTFGAGYAYSAKWWARPGTDGCTTAVGAAADFTAQVGVLGRHQQVLSVGVGVRDTAAEMRAHSFVTVLGAEIYTLDRHGPKMTVAVSPGMATTREAATMFLIGPIPVTLAAGAVGVVGLDLSLTAELDHAAGRELWCKTGVSVRQPLLAVVGQIRPHVDIVGFVLAGVGVPWARVSAHGELDLVRASLPFTVDVSVAPSKQTGDMSLVAGSELAAQIATMSGRVYLDASVENPLPFGPDRFRYRREFVSWKGIAYERTLLSPRTAEIPLASVATAIWSGQ